ncbi:MAG TPA: hypothetical protein PKM58_12825 [Pyrinomonadaceae bacterium]|nr:hypothetical protein [Pyrinomonadaceae bacterium]
MAPLWLLAMLLGMFPVSALLHGSSVRDGFVYCPLTKKLQPVKATAALPPVLGEICATDADKAKFIDQVIASRDQRLLSASPFWLESSAIAFLAGQSLDLHEGRRDLPGNFPARAEFVGITQGSFGTQAPEISQVAVFHEIPAGIRFGTAFTTLSIAPNDHSYSAVPLTGTGPRSPPEIS